MLQIKEMDLSPQQREAIPKLLQAWGYQREVPPGSGLYELYGQFGRVYVEQDERKIIYFSDTFPAALNDVTGALANAMRNK